MDEQKVEIIPAESYLNGRWEAQRAYSEQKAATNQQLFMRTRRLALLTGILTPVAIFVVVVVALLRHSDWAHFYHLIPVLLSAIAVGSYQWEELHNYGAQWAKFRLLAERLKRQRELFLYRAGAYRGLDDEQALKEFVEYCEGLIENTDQNYFVLMVDSMRREAG